MKVFLDDIRPAPSGWILARTATEAIRLLEKYNVTDLSLDHDLGYIDETGYDVLLWIEHHVFKYGLKFRLPNRITTHTSNPPAYKRMTQAINRIRELHYRNGECA